ncbi:MAG: hypothetical protein ACYSSL_03555 [Planctomycetota bacterium]|jgi:hypothetical protein
MSKETNKLPRQRNYDTIIIIATVIALAVIFMFFWDRQQERRLQLERLETQTDVMEEWGPQRQNQNTAEKGGGKIL